MKKICLAAFVMMAGAGVAMADDMSSVNGYRVEARTFNDFAGSNLLVNGVNTPSPTPPATTPVVSAVAGQAGPIRFQESFAFQEPGNFANKHIAWLSNDGGASRISTNRGQTWTLAFDYRMSAPQISPRKEGGVQINQNRPVLGYLDEGQILIASDGEVAVFGGTLPFTGFGTAYTLGQTAHLEFTYYAPGVQDPTKGAYRLTFNDPVLGFKDSGIKVWGNEPDGITGLTEAQIGLKDQNQRFPFIADSVDCEYSNISVVPAPASVALLGLGGLLAARRRRA